MIRLTRSYKPDDHNYIYVSPEHIVGINEHVPKNTLVHTTSSSTSIQVIESALDIARLRAVWERRYDIHKIIERNDMPIAVYMDPETGIQFMCCKHVQAANATARADAEDEEVRQRKLSGVDGPIEIKRGGVA